MRLEDLRDTAVAAEHAALRLESALTHPDQLTGSDHVAHALEVTESIGPRLADSFLWRGAVLIALLVGGLALVRRVPQRAG